MFDLSFSSQLNLAIICWNKEKSFRATRKRDYREDTWMAKLWHFHRGDKFVPHIASRKRQLIHFKICHLLGKRCSSYSGSVLSDLRNRWPMTWNICEYELTYKISLRPITRRFKWFEETNVNCLTPAQACQHLSGKSKFPSFPLYSIATEDFIIVN